MKLRTTYPAAQHAKNKNDVAKKTALTHNTTNTTGSEDVQNSVQGERANFTQVLTGLEVCHPILSDVVNDPTD